MTYTTSAKVQARSGVTTSEVSATHMTAILAWTDQEIDTIVENAYYYSEYFENQKDERVIIMNDVSTVSDFIKVEIDGDELFEEDKQELMDNVEVEEVDSGATGGVEDFTTASGTSATYTHSDTAHIGRKSLLITAATQETAYWETDDNITVSFPQDLDIPAYKFSCYIKTTSVTAGGGSGAYFSILWYSGSDTLLATDSNSANAITNTADWANVSLTKHAPDTAAYAKVRLINDAASGTVYFDTMKFRKVNWKDSIATPSVEFMKPYRNNFIAIWYSKTDVVNPLIENLATDLAARAALVHAGGGSVQGLSYTIDVLKVSKGKQSAERLKLIGQLTLAISDKITRLAEQGLLKDNKRDWVLGLNNL